MSNPNPACGPCTLVPTPSGSPYASPLGMSAILGATTSVRPTVWEIANVAPGCTVDITKYRTDCGSPDAYAWSPPQCGNCAPTCSGFLCSQSACHGCVNGTCQWLCAPGQVCQGGHCTTPLPPPPACNGATCSQSPCHGCVNGSCQWLCAPGQVCQGGHCTTQPGVCNPACNPPATCVNGSCVKPAGPPPPAPGGADGAVLIIATGLGLAGVLLLHSRSRPV